MVLSVILVESKIGIPEISALETEKSILVDKFFAEGGRDKKTRTCVHMVHFGAH